MSNTQERACHELWKEVFGDSDSIIAQFMQNHYRKSNMFSVEENGRLVSMLHLVTFNCNGHNVGYIYAVATAAEARKRGYATQLLKDAIAEGKRRGLAALLLIPASEDLRKYYNRFGFKGSYHIEFQTPDNFDFGDGHNNACLLPLTPDFTLGAGISLLKHTL